MTIDDGNQRAGWKKFLPLLVVVAGLIAYHNSFTGPFIFDDTGDIVENTRIRRLWPPWDARGSALRWVVNFSFAVNYALGGLDVWGYHAVNVAVHLLVALTLYGVVRRTLWRDGPHPNPLPRGGRGDKADWMALAVSLLWVVHPLNSQAVDYTVQRAESMMGLFYLLTLYCVIRGAENWGHNPISILKLGLCPQFSAFRVMSPNLWYLAAVVCCALGMGCKPVMAGAPLMVLIYERIFLSPSFKEVLARRRGLYTGLAMTWVLLGILRTFQPSSTDRGAGFGIEGLTSLGYALTQPGVVLHYLKLSFWPHPLVFDYAWPLAKTANEILTPAMILGAIVLGMSWVARRMPLLGFFGAWFFLILLPTSSFFPLQDLAVEHRMYLPLACVAVIFVAGGWELLGKLIAAQRVRGYLACGIVAVAVTVLGLVTIHRNKDYRDAISLWKDVVGKRPQSARGHNNLADALIAMGKIEEAIGHLNRAIKLAPLWAECRYNRGVIFGRQKKWREAAASYTEALYLNPCYAKAHNNLGMVLSQQGKTTQAMLHYGEALRLDPDLSEAHNNFGVILMRQGRIPEAIAHYDEALRCNPAFTDAYINRGIALAQEGKYGEAQAQYAKALALKPDCVDAHNNLGTALAKQGKWEEAMGYYRQTVRIQPDFAEAHVNLGNALLLLGKEEDSIHHFTHALRLQGDLPEAHSKLGALLVEQGKIQEAVDHCNQAIRLDPRSAEAHNNLGIALARQGKLQEAIRHFSETVRLKPDWVAARQNLGRALQEQGKHEEAARHFETRRKSNDGR